MEVVLDAGTSQERRLATGANERNRVVIVGGGLAGLAAAAALAERGLAVTLLESRPRLGGRASSIVDRATGMTIDNCQHVSMGCCTNFAHFCRTTGLDEFFQTDECLHFVGLDNRVSDFGAGRGPVPFHLTGALRNLGGLSFRDRLAIARGLIALARYRRSSPDRRSFADWLCDHRQPERAVENFWRVVLVSALSEDLDRVDIGYARKVFVDSFLTHPDGWKVQRPTVPLDDLYGRRLSDWLARHGVAVRLQAGVERLVASSDRVTSARLRDGESIPADHFVLAVPHAIAPSLLPAGLAEHPDLAGLARLESAPISSVHLWFDRPITDLPHAVLTGRLSQWVFARKETEDRRQKTGEKRPPSAGAVVTRAIDSAFANSEGPPTPDTPSANSTLLSPVSGLLSPSYYQVVISASRDVASQPAERTIAAVVDELVSIWPAAGEANLLHSRLITEHRAVFSPTPGVDSLRPPQQSPIANLQIAGDWTRTGWPATMEGAVRSGYLAAENILVRVGRPERILQPDLPQSFLSEVLFGRLRSGN